MRTILGIETSCDDTSAAVVQNDRVLSNVIASQDIHDAWGGIVPELASREHVKAISVIVMEALKRASISISGIDAIAVTNGPGLPGSLHVGTQFAKGLAFRYDKPLFPIHHIEAHVYSGYIDAADLQYPSITLVVSGGHTSLFVVRSAMEFAVLGSTRDDAAGEAFDKIAKMLGLGYPGGPHIDRIAKHGDASSISFPLGLIDNPDLDFSFSGLKTAVKRYIQQNDEYNISNVAAAAQQAIINVLVVKTMRAVEKLGSSCTGVTIAGGVGANSLLRTSMSAACAAKNIRFVAPQMEYCVDNAAMIGFLALMRFAQAPKPDKYFTIDPRAIRS